MKASVLAIGTELTTGQITNKNASTLSKKLYDLGIVCQSHLTVPDDRKLILDSLHYLEKNNDLLFITGGLGPTTDDFTRDVIAEWLHLTMNFDEKSWNHIVERLQSRGFTAKEMQKQQCYFPEGCEILENPQGTAHAFKLTRSYKNDEQSKDQYIFVLPGPPREIEAIWNQHILPQLRKLTKDLPRRRTKSWDTLGLGESDVAYLVEEVLQKFPKSKELEIGYRVHLPYVEVKVTYEEKKKDVFQETFFQIEEKLKKITVARDFEDIADLFCQKISKTDFTFYDYLSTGYLHSRLSPSLKNFQQWSFKQATTTTSEVTVDFFENEDNFLALLPYEEFSCLILGSFQSRRFQKIIEAPMKSSLMSERRLQYFSELALVEMLKIC